MNKKPTKTKADPTAKPVVKKTSGPRNKTAGHNFERLIVQALKDVGFEHASSSRLESRARDNQKIDIMNKEEGKNGRIPYNIQCKNLVANDPTGKFPYAEILASMPKGDEKNVIFHNSTVRRGTRFMLRGQYAHMGLHDFVVIIGELHKAKKAVAILNDYFDCIPEEDKLAVTTKLEALGF